MGHNREITKRIIPEVTKDGAGVVLKRALGTRGLDYVDPFLMLDHFGSDDPDDFRAGFPMHPHRGIETVTYVLKGSVKHRDSEGNEGIIRPGGVQWMTSGSGIIHEEMPQVEDGELEGFQLWVNLPAAFKMVRPKYREVSDREIPYVDGGDGVKVKVIAGSFEGTLGSVTDLRAPVGMLDVSLEAGCGFRSDVPAEHNAFIYVFRGSVTAADGEDEVSAPGLAVLGAGESVRLGAGVEGAKFLLVHGRPLGEPVARYGPFVMNTRAEIAQAIEDLNNGTFVK